MVCRPRTPPRFASRIIGRGGGDIDAGQPADSRRTPARRHASPAGGEHADAVGHHMAAAAGRRSRRHRDPASTGRRDHAGPPRRTGGAARRRQARHQAGAAAALQGVLPRRHRHRRCRNAAGAARQGRLRQHLRPPAGDRPRRQAVAERFAESGRHLPPAAARGRPASRRLLHRERVRHHGAAGAAPDASIPRTRPLLRAAALSQQAHRRTAVARHLGLCPTAPARRHDRMREPERHRSGPPRAAAVTSRRRRRPGARGPGSSGGWT